jgi:hypothetical protein
MLYQHADTIMTKKIPTMIIKGGNSMAGTMPSPRSTGGGVPSVSIQTPTFFLGEDAAPAATSGIMDTLKKPAVLIGLAAAIVFLTPIGAPLRRKLGMG